jgi:hypothetical protein
MSFDVRIERLVLEGLHVTPAERRRVQGTVECELTRLLSSTPRQEFSSVSRCCSSTSVRTIAIPRGQDAHSLGNGIASAVYDAIGGTE